MQTYANNKPLKIGQAAKLMGVSVDTLRRWELKNKLVALKTPGGTRFYLRSQLEEFNPSLVKDHPKSIFLKLTSKFPKLGITSLKLGLTAVVATLTICAVYLSIPPADDSLSSVNIKPNAQIASVQNWDNQNLNQSAHLLGKEADLVVEPSPSY